MPRMISLFTWLCFGLLSSASHLFHFYFLFHPILFFSRLPLIFSLLLFILFFSHSLFHSLLFSIPTNLPLTIPFRSLSCLIVMHMHGCILFPPNSPSFTSSCSHSSGDTS
ncbi:MAG: hypothetical protein JOS17DRAFT_74484 [Linnemannia elongata]|nr:MAG: hypothetical protein JOS17DRAFT_74484 [Linnemannia elongata]